ncbi:luciferin sulfotransferase-like isoform X2 [Daphnia pulex]|uniref:luciferin sulfotransferase-like isoform X2 n=1 Tax=Daphnia pulex TaxID=6669 RepID=UPI001EDF51E6|nr:luciferin sulfotransferase-like isoform X2 [Daphnia pulex]
MADVGVVGQHKRRHSKSAHRVKFNLITQSKLAGPFTDHFPHYAGGVARSEPGGFVISQEFGHHAHEFFYFQPRKDDVWMLTFPKCGTTWTQELVWMVANNCNVEVARRNPLFIRSPYLEASRIASLQSAPPEVHVMVPKVNVIERIPSPRVIKSHLPFSLLHPQLLDISKVIYVVRHPKDVIVSYFHHHKLFNRHGFLGDVELFAQYFMNDEVYYSPYFPHVLDAWSKRNHPNMLFLLYEDLRKDLREGVIQIAKFLKKQLTEKQLADVCQHLDLETFANNECINYEKMAKSIGLLEKPDQRSLHCNKPEHLENVFSPEMNRRIEEWIDKNLEGTDFHFA